MKIDYDNRHYLGLVLGVRRFQLVISSRLVLVMFICEKARNNFNSKFKQKQSLALSREMNFQTKTLMKEDQWLN